MMNTSKRLTNLQLELIKLFSYNLSERQLMEVKDMLAKYFASKATEEMDKIWEDEGLNNETMEAWADEHMRAPSQNAR